jgi:SAM-dependent methyltransferase
LKTKKAEWFRSWFNTQAYLDLYRHRDEHDAKKIVSLLFNQIELSKGSKVLDLACGNGRHSVLFAKKGLDVTGVDLSDFLINQANKKLFGEYSRYQKNMRFEIRDMRSLKHVSEFDLVVNIFTSFGYFDSNRDNERVIKTISNALKPGGYFLLDFLNRNYLEKNLVPFDLRTVDGKLIAQSRTIKDNYVEKNILIFTKYRSIKGYPLFNHFKEKIKLYSLKDFGIMFNSNSLRMHKVFGSYNGERYNINKSERLIILARKKK